MKKLFDEIPHIESERLMIDRLRPEDSQALYELMTDKSVYRYVPTFLLEKQTDDPQAIIQQMYTGCIETRTAIFLGVFLKENRTFCGMVELYGYKEAIHKISIGQRLKSDCWGKGIASEAVDLVVKYLYSETDIEIITASSMPDNIASSKVLQKSGFQLVVAASEEDWGFEKPVTVHKWIR